MKKRSTPKKNIFILIPILVLLLAGILYFSKSRKTSNFENAFSHRFSAGSSYLSRLSHTNKNFIMDHSYQIGQKYIEKKFYRWNDKTEMTFDKGLSLELKEYLSEKQIPLEDISVTIVSLKNGDRFNLNDKEERLYSNIEKLLVNMSIIRLLDNKMISTTDKISVLQGDLTVDSVYFTKDSIGLTYELKELMKLSFSKNDITAKNMLKRYVIEKTNTKFDEFIKKEFNITIFDRKSSTSQTINIARELNRHKNLYRDIVANDKKTESSDFIKFIVKDESQNYYIKDDTQYYDIGVINGSNQYIYSVYIRKQTDNTISEIGDLIDRKINEYYLLKNI